MGLASSGCLSALRNQQTEPKVDLLEVSSSSEQEKLPPEFEVTHKVEVQTTKGSFVIGLYGNDAPRTVANFLKYVDNGHYVDKIFHRVIPRFMVQGGGFDVEMTYAKTDLPIELEIIPGLKHTRGVVSMARTGDPDSASSQFFVCVGDAPNLNGTYASFGLVLEGMDVVEAIANVPTATVETEYRPMSDVPVSPVLIQGVTRR